MKKVWSRASRFFEVFGRETSVTYLWTVRRVIGEEDCYHSFTTVVCVIHSATPHAVACAGRRTIPPQTRPAFVTRPKCLSLKSRRCAFSEFCVRTAKNHYCLGLLNEIVLPWALKLTSSLTLKHAITVIARSVEQHEEGSAHTIYVGFVYLAADTDSV